MTQMNDLELYIHIPFCVRKCNYCDFISFAGCGEKMDAYVAAVCREIQTAARSFHDRKIRTVYIGGGTPSILNPEQISRMMETLTGAFRITGTREKRKGLFRQKKKTLPETEVTIECNPGTVDKDKLRTWKKLGINRVSIGLQSTDNEDLKTLGRIHTYDDFEHTFDAAREAGFDNINIDLMQAIPGQTLPRWKKVLALAALWKPEHISAYSLIIEPGTPFEQMQKEGKLPLPDEDTEREIYYYTRDFLEKAGYERYEISNYAQPGYECVHNCGYWTGADYLGLGLHASSLINHKRWKNTDDLDRYIRICSEGSPEDQMLSALQEETEELSRQEQMEEFVILGLRMCKGISRTEFLDRFGQDMDLVYGDEIRRMEDLNLLEEEEDRIRLTSRGIDVSNTVLAEFMK